MKKTIILLTCVLLFEIATAASSKITVLETSAGLRITCSDSSHNVTRPSGQTDTSPLTVPYQDDMTGEYKCSADEVNTHKIYVKFRTCENCVKMDLAAIIGVAVVDAVATGLIALGFYLVASRVKSTSFSSDKKKSDRQRLIPNDGGNLPKGSESHYEHLQKRKGEKEYDRLAFKK